MPATRCILPGNRKPVLLQKLKEMDMLTLYKDIELPLVFVLYDMENEGIRADGIKLKDVETSLLFR